MPEDLPIGPDASRPALLRYLMLVTLIAVVVALWYLASHSLRLGKEVHWIPSTTPCNLHGGACTARLEDSVLAFEMGGEGPIRALEILPLTVSLSGLEARSVEVEFVGRDMDMGLHRFALSPGEDGVFRGEGQLSLCTDAVMPWQARVVVETADGQLGSRFDFDVERPGR
jgi:hypothetical protein